MTMTDPGVESRKQSQASASAGSSPSAYQELWLSISTRPWKSLVLVPVDPDGSVMELTVALAEAGSQLSDAPVNSLIAEAPDFLNGPSSSRVPAKTLVNRITSLRHPESTGQLVIALPPLSRDPLAAVVARRADVTLLCIHKGKSETPAVRRTLQLIGRDRVAGCLWLA
jgi:hypothetical protein